MARTHDMGGRPDDAPLDLAEHVAADWEVVTDALVSALGPKGLRSTDQLRRAMEDMPADDWRKMLCVEAAAVERLWQCIFRLCRIDQPDPETAWRRHVFIFAERARWLKN